MSIALPVTFGGVRFLAALWLLIAMGSIALVVTSAPARERWVPYLQRELGLEAPSPVEVGPVSKGEVRRAVQLTLGELRLNRDRFQAAVKSGQYPTPVVSEWPHASASITAYPGSEAAYDAAQAAYHWIEEFMNRAVGASRSESMAMGSKSRMEAPVALKSIEDAIEVMVRYRDELNEQTMRVT